MTNSENARERYGDIIDLPRPCITKRKPMSMHDRAAQFAPFAALSGYDDMVREEARLTDTEHDLSESELEELGRTLTFIMEQLRAGIITAVSVSYFLPDKYKSGGSYETVTGKVKEVDPLNRRLLLYGGSNTEDKRCRPLEIPFDRMIVLNLI